jgi:hypothetical protein
LDSPRHCSLETTRLKQSQGQSFQGPAKQQLDPFTMQGTAGFGPDFIANPQRNHPWLNFVQHDAVLTARSLPRVPVNEVKELSTLLGLFLHQPDNE